MSYPSCLLYVSLLAICHLPPSNYSYARLPKPPGPSYIPTYLSTYPMYLSTYPLIHSIYLLHTPPIYPFIHLPTYLITYQSIYRSIDRSIYFSTLRNCRPPRNLIAKVLRLPRNLHFLTKVLPRNLHTRKALRLPLNLHPTICKLRRNLAERQRGPNVGSLNLALQNPQRVALFEHVDSPATSSHILSRVLSLLLSSVSESSLPTTCRTAEVPSKLPLINLGGPILDRISFFPQACRASGCCAFKSCHDRCSRRAGLVASTEASRRHPAAPASGGQEPSEIWRNQSMGDIACSCLATGLMSRTFCPQTHKTIQGLPLSAAFPFITRFSQVGLDTAIGFRNKCLRTTSAF